MRVRLTTASVVSLSLAACGGGAPPGPPALAYDLPRPAAVQYVVGDTATMDIDAGGQAMQAYVASATTLGTSFSRAPEGVEVSMTVEELDAKVTNPLGAVTADESGIDGTLTFRMDRKGAATVVSQPELNETSGQFFQPLTLATSLFPRLPGRAATVGESWTDTIRVEGEQGPGTIKATTIMTYTLVGDTVVDGRSALKVTMEGNTETSARGVTTGTDFQQTLSGKVSGWFLWDQQRNLMLESLTDSDARGSMEVTAAPFPLSVRIRSQNRVTLHEGM